MGYRKSGCRSKSAHLNLKCGPAERTRTSDFFLRREALYPLSYGRERTRRLPDEFFDHLAVHVGQAEVAPQVGVGRFDVGRPMKSQANAQYDQEIRIHVAALGLPKPLAIRHLVTAEPIAEEADLLSLVR